MKAIETQYKGYRFRSRLEARWAVFFDALGLKWEYEPEGFELGGGVRYLPDFRVTGTDTNGDGMLFWFEVKPDQILSSADIAKVRAFATQNRLILLDGPPELRSYRQVVPTGGWELGLEANRCLSERETWFLWSLRRRPWWTNGDDEDIALDGRYHCSSKATPTPRDDWEAAVCAARGARFEHGESGAPARPDEFEAQRK